MEKPIRSQMKKRDQSLLEALLSEPDSFEIETLPPWQQQFLTAYMFKEAQTKVSVTVIEYTSGKKRGPRSNKKSDQVSGPLFESKPGQQHPTL